MSEQRSELDGSRVPPPAAPGRGAGRDLESPAPPVAAPDGVPRTATRVLRWLLWSLLGVTVLSGAIIVAIIVHYSRGLPDVETLKSNYAPPELTRIFARDGTLLANVFTERRTVIPFDEIPDHAKLAFLAAEDAAFYEHEGLDYFSILRAVIANLRAGATRQGGSTITQQVVKNVLLDPERTYRRKIRETILARRLEQSLTKDEIFSLYLNHIYLGHGRYGIEEAARYYFGKKARALDLSEAALLAGLVAAPERFSPRHYPDRSLERRHYVLAQMVAKGFLTSELRERIDDAPLRLAPAIEAESELAPEVVARAKKVLRKAVGPAARRGGFEVYTTIEPRLQAAARKAVRDNLQAYLERHKLRPPFRAPGVKRWGKPFEGEPKRNEIYTGVVVGADDSVGTIDVRVGKIVGVVFLAQQTQYNPTSLPPSQFAEKGATLRVSLASPPRGDGKPPLRLEIGPQSALVALDVRTREVVALVGNYEALVGGFDRASQSKLQPGSSFKPFLYSYALHSRRFTPASVLALPGKRGKESRKISVREAIAASDNAAALHLFHEVGPANVVGWAHAVGIESELKADDSLPLGAYEVRPIEIANAYATFASGGEYAPAVLITRALAHGRQPVELPALPPRRQVMQPDEAYLTTSLLESVVRDGTGRRARSLGRPVAGKTGTTNDDKDTWFVGYSTDFVAAVWVGYDDGLPLGDGESGAATALPAWIQFMKQAHEGRPVTDFTRPSNIVVTRIDPKSGLLAPEGYPNAREEEFLEGTEPETVVSLEPDGGVAYGDAGAAQARIRDKPDPLPYEIPPF